MKFNKGDIVRIKRDRCSTYPYVDLWYDIGIVIYSTPECTEVLFKNHDNFATKNHTYDIATTALKPAPELLTWSQTHTTSFSIKDVIFNDPAVIVLWNDGSKTVVKCSENDIFDPEKGLAMAISKKSLGNQGNYYETFKKYLPEEEDIDDFGLDPLDPFVRLREAAAKLTKDMNETFEGLKNQTSEPTKQTAAYDDPYTCVTCEYLCQPLGSEPCYGCTIHKSNQKPEK